MSHEHDRLLAWLSARGAASNEALQEACTALTPQSSRHILSNRMELLEPLRRLGHVERDREWRGWRIVVPTILWQGRQNGCGFVCGARDHDLGSKLSTQLGARFMRIPGRNGPERWSLWGDRVEIQRQTQDLGLRWAPNCIPELFAALPTAGDAISALPEQEYLACAFARRQWKRLALSDGQPIWRTVDTARLDENRNLMRSCELGQQDWWLWIEAEGIPKNAETSALAVIRARRLPSIEYRRLARWLVILRASKKSGKPPKDLSPRLSWSATTQQLEVPWFRGAPLPHLLDRGLCLLTGHCPAEPLDEHGSRTATYQGVSHPIAKSVARILTIPLVKQT